MATDPSDESLLALFRDPLSRNKAFEAILDKYQKRVYWQIRRLVIDHDDADDVLQNTFIKVWENLDKFREDARLFTWIYRIATNEALHFMAKRRTVSIDEVDPVLLEKLQAGSHFNGNRAEMQLQTAILQLPDKQRLVFNMKYYENLKYEEIGEITGTSVGALKASYHLAVKKIETFLTGTLNLSPQKPSNP
jgi:RNA polymerase sigma factor (sigma-70 family)